MDNSDMSHEYMDTGMGHGDPPMCSMNMLFTWSTQNLCIVFRSWHITGPVSLIFSLLAIVALSAGYELVRELARKYEERHAGRIQAFGNVALEDGENGHAEREREHSSSMLWVGGRKRDSVEREGKVVKALFYAVQVFYSFFIMLLFMTYNGWIMLAVAVGAFIGYLAFGSGSSPTKSVACH